MCIISAYVWASRRVLRTKNDFQFILNSRGNVKWHQGVFNCDEKKNYVIRHTTASRSTHVNFCKGWRVPNYVERGGLFPGRRRQGRDFPKSAMRGAPSVSLQICYTFFFPHLRDRPETGYQNNFEASSWYVVLGREGLNENYKNMATKRNYHVSILVGCRSGLRPSRPLLGPFQPRD